MNDFMTSTLEADNGISQVLQLSDLAARINLDIAREFPVPIYLRAEVANFRYHEENSYYSLTLIQTSDQGRFTTFPAVIWRGGISSVKRFEQTTKQAFGNGLEVTVRVKVKYHSMVGITINILDISSDHFVGSMAAKKEINKKKLQANGSLFLNADGSFTTINKKLLASACIKKIAFIGSLSSDGYLDFVNEITNNIHGYGFHLTLYNAPVQGQHAAQLIQEALLEIDFTRDVYDVIVIGRGGGSQSDLSCFDDYDLADLIARFPIPIITGIGHERDESLCDIVAWRSTKTPTRAAVEVVEYNLQFENRIKALNNDIRIACNSILSNCHLKSESLFTSICSVGRGIVDSTRSYSNSVFSEIKSNDVEVMLSKGYCVLTAEGKTIKSASDLAGFIEGEFVLRFADGYLTVRLSR
jgi:exodeoxyribonuclease VII large subunit